MVRVLVAGLACLLVLSACGETAHDPQTSSVVAGSSAGGSAGSSSANAGAAQQAGSVGVGGASAGATSAATAAVAECVRYCDTLEYLLPAALCEDWNRPGWDPEFCHVGPSMGCSDYCTQVFESVKPACAETLPAVMRCVSPTYASLGVPPADLCWLKDCRDQLFTMTSACYGLREKLAAARATWEASGISDYELTYPFGDGVTVRVVVHAGSEPTVTPPNFVGWTVPKLFNEVERYLDQPGKTAKAEYDPKLGYVVALGVQSGCEEYPVGVASQVVVTPLPR